MSVTEEIKARLDIVNVVSQYVPQLKRSGRSYSAPCPFHAERTPSFFVFPDTQTWRCFGACGEGGDIFTFVMKQEGLDFPSALRTLAERAGVQLQERSPEQTSHDQHLDKLRGLLDEVRRFFHETLLKSPAAREARAYVAKRGLTEETIERFSIGYAPHEWHDTLDHLLRLGYTEEEALEAGVIIRNEEKGRSYDRFRNRVIIPIHDGRGQMIGFGARALAKEDNPKYLNSPQTPLFDKSATLFAMNMARRAIRESETAIIVEGYMDAIQAHQAGFNNVVAQMGTALTEPQLKQLSRHANRIILALDPDAAGIKATMRGLDVARKTLGDSGTALDAKGISRQAEHLNIDLLVMTLPDGQDPDDLIRDNPAGWQQLLAEAQPVAQYVINAGTAHLTPQSSFAEREKAARELLPILMATENTLHEQHNIQLLALKLRIKEETLIEWAEREHSREVSASNKRKVEQKTRQEKLNSLMSPRPGQPKSASTAGTRRNQPGTMVEHFVLAEMLRRPNYFYYANRRLRELASEVAERLREPLGPLSVRDFTRVDYQMIFSCFEQALAQDDDETLEWMAQNLPAALHQEVELLLTEELDAYKGRLAASLHRELEAITRDRVRFNAAALQDEDEFVRQVLELRQQRLKRENVEFQYLQQELSQQNDLDRELAYVSNVSINKLAIASLDRAINQMSDLQRAQR